MKVDRLGLAGRFALVLSSDRLGSGKPDPAAYRAACERLGAEPALTGYVDDSRRDAGGAALAGLQSCWLDRARRGGAPAGQRVVTDLDRLLIERAGR